jgi:hypothetical protein
MANTFRNVLYEVTDTLSTFYTAPASAGAVAIVIGCQAANKTGGVVALDLVVDDGVDSEFLLNDVSIPVAASLNCIAGKLVLEASDTLKAQCGTTGDVSIVLSVLEIT